MDTETQSANEPKPEINTPSQSNNLLRKMGLIAGIMLIIAGIAMIFIPFGSGNDPQRQENDQTEELTEEEKGPYSEYFSPLAPPSFTAGAKGQSSLAIYQRALEAYSKKDYSEAIGLFKQALENSDFASEHGAQANLYLAISLLETKQTRSALQILEPYELHPDYKSDVRWYQAQGYIQLDDRENALHTLFSIARNPDHPHTLAAQILLREFVPDAEE